MDVMDTRQTWRRRAIIISIVFHIGLAIVLFAWYLPQREEASHPNEFAIASGAASEPARTSPPPDLPKPAPAPDVPADQLEASIESQIEQFEKLPDERKLSELEKNLQRLEAISNEESVAEVTSSIANTLGLEAGAEPAEQEPEGAFDHQTAQLHDVQRVEGDDGKVRYQSVLVDAEGRTQSVDMSAAEGESAYEAFQQMKRYPFAAEIYRNVVMPLIQKSIEASELAEQAMIEAERLESEQQ